MFVLDDSSAESLSSVESDKGFAFLHDLGGIYRLNCARAVVLCESVGSS